jgi:pyruvate dehydrogenase E1 component alpha subunit
VSVNLTDQDTICTIYRGIHDMLAKGVPPRLLWAEIAGQGHRHLQGQGRADAHHASRSGVMVTTGIVGSSMPDRQRPGAGRADPRREARQRWPTSATARRTSAPSTRRSTWPRVEAAGDLRLPEQRLRRAHALRARHLGSAVSDRAAGYQMPGVTVDGNDPLAV